MKKLFLMLFLSLLIVSTSKAQIPIIPKAVGDTIVVLSPVFDGLSFADSIWNQKKLQMDSCAWSQGFYSNPVRIIPVLSDLISETDTVSLDFGNGLVDTVLVGIDAIFYSISRGGKSKTPSMHGRLDITTISWSSLLKEDHHQEVLFLIWELQASEMVIF